VRFGAVCAQPSEFANAFMAETLCKRGLVALLYYLPNRLSRELGEVLKRLFYMMPQGLRGNTSAPRKPKLSGNEMME